MSKIMISRSIIILRDELDQPQQIERLADNPPLRAGVDDGLGVEGQLFDGIRQRREVYFIEVRDGDERVGLRQRDEGKAGELALLVDFLFLFEVFVVRGFEFALSCLGGWGR